MDRNKAVRTIGEVSCNWNFLY